MTETKRYPSRDADQFMVRLPDGKRDEIREAAQANKRSMNAEIVARLEQPAGMTLRDWITGQALPWALSQAGCDTHFGFCRDPIEMAFRVADEMIAARSE